MEIVHLKYQIAGFELNLDTLFTSWAVMLLLLLVAFIASKQLKQGNIGPLQYLFEGIYDLWDKQLTSQVSWRPRLFLPLCGGIFLFVLGVYFFGLLPWKVGFLFEWWPELAHGHRWEGASPAADFNVPLGMAIVSVLAYLGAGTAQGGIAYWAQYFGFKQDPVTHKLSFNPLSVITALIEWMDLLLRPLSLSLRLFANAYAGEVLVATFVKLVPLGIPLVPLLLEIGVGFIQAMIFALLTLVYVAIAVSHGSTDHAEGSAEHGH